MKEPRESFEFDINKMPRSLKAWEAAISLLNDGRWHHYCEIIHVMLENSDIQPGSCANLLKHLLRQRLVDISEDKRWYCRIMYAPTDFPESLSKESLNVSTYIERGTGLLGNRPRIADDNSIGI